MQATFEQKPFERSLIQWKISNFVFSDKTDFVLRSPDFFIYASQPWYLELNWQSRKEQHQHSLYIDLNRVKNDPILNHRLSYRMAIVNDDENPIWTISKDWYEDEGLFSCWFANFNPENYISKFRVCCEIFIYNDFPESQEVNLMHSDFALRLSKESENREKKNNTKVHLISNDDNEMEVERNICYLSPVLKDKIEKSSNHKIYLNISGKEMIQMIAFLTYNTIINHPYSHVCFGLDKVAKYFKIEGLKMQLSPKVIYMASDAYGEDNEITWIIENFSKKNPNEYITSNRFKTTSGLEWRLKLRETQTGIGCYVEILRCNPEFNAHFIISASSVDKNDVKLIKVLSPATCGTFGKDEFITKGNDCKYISRYLLDNVLTIKCRLCHSDMKFTSKISSVFDNYVTVTEDYKDIVSAKFAEHWRILLNCVGIHLAQNIRSEACAELLKILTKTEIDLTSNIPGDVVELILKFIFTGRLCTTDFETVKNIYILLKHGDIKVFLLKEICTDFLIATTENMFDKLDLSNLSTIA